MPKVLQFSRRATRANTPLQEALSKRRAIATAKPFSGAAADLELRRITGIGKVLAAGIGDINATDVLAGLEFDLEQARARIAESWPQARLKIIGNARASWRGVEEHQLIGTLKQKAQAQLGLCAAFLEATAEAQAHPGDRWKSYAVLTAQSLLRLHGLADALEILRDTVATKRVEKAAQSKRARGKQSLDLVSTKARSLLQQDASITRDAAADRIAAEVHLSSDRVKKLLSQTGLFSRKSRSR